MTKATLSILSIVTGAAAVLLFGQAPVSQPTLMPPGANPNSQYRLGPDSLPQDGVPKGEIRGPFVIQSNVYPGTQHTYWVYVPQQYDPQFRRV